MEMLRKNVNKFCKKRKLKNSNNPKNWESRGAKLLWQGAGTESLLGCGAKPHELKHKFKTLMVEKSKMSKRHNHIVFVGGRYNVVVADRTACFGYVFYSALFRSLYVISEWEERIGT